MGLTYPKINPPEGLVFREQFINNQYVADNGGTLVGAPTVDNGITLDGSTQYATYDGSFFANNDEITIEIWFTPDFNWNEDANRYFCDSTAGSQFYIRKYDNAGNNVLRTKIGDTVIADISSASYSNFWVQGRMNHLVVCAASGDTDTYLNGNLVDEADASAWSPASPATFFVGSSNAPASYFDGVIKEISVYGRKLTAGEVADRLTQQTFKEPIPEFSEIWLPLRSHYYDTGVSKEVTTNLGNINSDQIRWGDGSTTTTYPTQLSPNGIYCGGGASSDFVQTPKVLSINAGESFTFSALAQPIGTAGVDYLFSFKDADANGISAYLSSDSVTFFADSGGTGRLVTSTGFGIAHGLYHVACVIEYNGATYDYYLYKNGELVGSSLAKGGYTQSEGDVGFTLGADQADTQGWAGNIFLPIFTRQALTPTQIKWLKEYSYNSLNI